MIAKREKPCSKCGDTKPLGDFGKLSTAPDGCQTWCRACFAAYARAYQARGNTPEPEELMSYAEIGRRLGLTREGACEAGKRAMRKVRAEIVRQVRAGDREWGVILGARGLDLGVLA